MWSLLLYIFTTRIATPAGMRRPGVDLLAIVFVFGALIFLCLSTPLLLLMGEVGV